MQRYRLGTITFTGNKQITNIKALRATFPLKDGDWFNATLMCKGLENLKKAYGGLGYINFGAIPKPIYDEQKKTVSFDIDIDEGKQFYVSRIEFQGNTITRDRVIRRELLLDEGQVYNSQLWEYSLLRLNQLEYFEPLKVDQDSEAHQDADNGTVELLLKVKEKGKNSIGLNGGVSGLSGAFLGINYQTNNFLGLGETLSVQGNLGNVSRQFLFGFTQPYFRNRPSQLGFQIYNNKSDFNSAKNYQTTTGASAESDRGPAVAHSELQSGSHRLELLCELPASASCIPARRLHLFALDRSTITAFSTASQTFFQTISFRSGIQGYNALKGIVTSQISFTYAYNTINNPVRPRTGKEYTAAFQVAGIWGNVRYFSPLVAYKRYRRCTISSLQRTVTTCSAIRAQIGYVQGYGGDCGSSSEPLLRRRRKRIARL